MSINTKAVLTFQLRDKDTLEIVSEHEYKNTFSKRHITSMFPVTGYSISGIKTATSLFLSSYPGIEDPLGSNRVGPNSSTTYPTISNTSLEQAWEYNNSTIPYHEAIFRFLPGSADRDIRMAFLGSSSSPASVIKVDPICVQSSNLVLDIKYRIFMQAPGPTDGKSESDILKGRTMFAELQSYGSTEPSARKLWSAQFPIEYPKALTMHIPPTGRNGGTLAASFYGVRTHVSASTDGSLEWERSSAEQGSIYSTFNVGFASVVGCAMNTTMLASGGFPYTLDTSKVEGYGPIQTVHHHSRMSTLPFEDIDYLSSSSAVVEFQENNIQPGYLPKTYNIRHFGSGAIGQTTYNYTSKPFFGLLGNHYSSSGIAAGVGLGPAVYIKATGNIEPCNDMHGAANHLPCGNKVEYNPTTWISFDRKGIDIFNYASGESFRYDSDNKGLQVSNIYTIATDFDTGDIWIACEGTGLWRIQNPFSNLGSVSLMTQGLNGIQPGGCKGTDVGYNGKVWALFDGALCSSADRGASWIKHNESSNSFVFPGITDLNWHNAKGISCDRTNPEDVVAIGVRHTSPDVQDINNMRILFHRNAANTNILSDEEFISSNKAAGEHERIPSGAYPAEFGSIPHAHLFINTHGKFGFTKRHGIFTLSESGTGQSPRNKLYMIDPYSGLTIYSTNTTGISPVSGPFYDGLGVPIFFDPNTSSAKGFSPDGMIMSSHYAHQKYIGAEVLASGPYSSSVSTGAKIAIESDIGVKGSSYHFGIPTLNNTTDLPGRKLTDSVSCIHFDQDSFSGEDMVTEDLVYSEYIWDGSQFKNKELGMVPAHNSADATKPAKRVNFKPGEYLLRGRQYFDITQCLPPTGQKMSLSMTMKKRTKRDTRTSHYETILSISMTNSSELNLYRTRSTTNPNILTMIKGDDRIDYSVEIDDSSDVRLTYVLDGLDTELFIDGVSLGQFQMSANNEVIFDYVDHSFIGAKIRVGGANTFLPMPNRLLSAEVKDILIWSSSMTAVDAAADNAAYPSIAIPVSMTGANNIANLKLTEAISETRVSHSGSLALDDNLSISMQDGPSGSGNSITHSDFHTMTLTDGILSDNTNKFTVKTNTYVTSTQEEFKTMNGVGDVAQVPGTGYSVSDITMPMSGFSRSGSYNFEDKGDYKSAWPGAYVKVRAGDHSGFGRVRLSGVFSVTFKARTVGQNIFVGFHPSVGSHVEDGEGSTYGMTFHPDGTVGSISSTDGVDTGMSKVQFDVDDLFKMTRGADNKITLSRVDEITLVEEILDVSLAEFQSDLFFFCFLENTTISGSGLTRIRYSYSLPPNQSYVGSQGLATGIYDRLFTAITSQRKDFKIVIDGITIIPEVTDYHEQQLGSPLPSGSARIYTGLGFVEFSPLDINKSLSFETTVIRFHGA